MAETIINQPKQTKYRFGVYAEYRAKDTLQQAGFVVVRAASSQGPADLVALRKDVTLLVQCKRGRHRPSPYDWRTLTDLETAMGTVKAVVYYPAIRGSVGHVIWADLSGWSEEFLSCLLAEAGWIDGRRVRQFKLRGL